MHAEVDNEMHGRICLRAMRACSLCERKHTYVRCACASSRGFSRSNLNGVTSSPRRFPVLCPRLFVRYTQFNSYIMPPRRQKQSNRYISKDTGQSKRQCRIKKRGNGHRLPSQAKYIVESVRTFFNNEKMQQRSTLRNRVIERTAKACGVAVRTVYSIQSEFRSSAGILSTPEQRYTKSRVQIKLDDFNVEAICRTVHEFYTRKEYPTLESLLATVKSRGVFSGGRTTLKAGAKGDGISLQVARK